MKCWMCGQELLSPLRGSSESRGMHHPTLAAAAGGATSSLPLASVDEFPTPPLLWNHYTTVQRELGLRAHSQPQVKFLIGSAAVGPLYCCPQPGCTSEAIHCTGLPVPRAPPVVPHTVSACQLSYQTGRHGWQLAAGGHPRWQPAELGGGEDQHAGLQHRHWPAQKKGYRPM
jgi:hypothetical protein